jgi:hypothetical protein
MNESVHGLPAFHFAAGAANAPPGAPPGAPAPPGEATIPTPSQPGNPAVDAGLSGESQKKHISRRGREVRGEKGEKWLAALFESAVVPLPLGLGPVE